MSDEQTESKEERKMEMHDHDHYHHWHGPKLALLIIGLVLIFGVLMAAGHARQRRFALNGAPYGAGYMMKGPGGHPRGGRGMHGMRGSRVLGSVSSISDKTVVVHTSDKDVTVTVADTTSFYKNNAVAKLADLKTGDIISVMGTPDANGNIQATVIIISTSTTASGAAGSI